MLYPSPSVNRGLFIFNTGGLFDSSFKLAAFSTENMDFVVFKRFPFVWDQRTQAISQKYAFKLMDFKKSTDIQFCGVFIRAC